MTLSDVLSAYDLSHEMIHQLVVVTKPIYNLRTLIAGNRFELEKLPDGTLKTFTYAVDLDKYVEVSLTDKGYQAAMKPFEYETQRALISGTVQSSLFQTMNELNERDQLALDIAETFSYDIDFNSELRSGDHFKVAIEKQYQNGEFVKYGRILAAEFNNKGRVYSAFYFTDPQGRSEYYDARGRALKRDLLKSPVKFSRVRLEIQPSPFSSGARGFPSSPGHRLCRAPGNTSLCRWKWAGAVRRMEQGLRQVRSNQPRKRVHDDVRPSLQICGGGSDGGYGQAGPGDWLRGSHRSGDRAAPGLPNCATGRFCQSPLCKVSAFRAPPGRILHRV